MWKPDRSNESIFTNWYFSIDKTLFGLVLLMIFIAMIMAISSGSAMFVRTMNMRHNIEWYEFFIRMIPYYLIGVGTLFGVSMLGRNSIMKLAWADLILCFVLLLGTVAFPHVMNHSHRWLVIPGLPRIMPSDLMKPGFVIISAWFISKMQSIYGKDTFDLKRTLYQIKTWSWLWYLIPFAIVLGIQFWHPDFGTMALYLATFCIMLIVGGLPKRWIVTVVGCGMGLGVLGILLLKHVRERTFALFDAVDPHSQIGIALRAIRNGGVFGAGDKADIVEHLPMAESDFVLSVIAENFGAIAACGIILLLLFVVARLLKQSRCARNDFVSNAVAGTAAMFGVQSCINLASTLRLMPAKGMTLPFISHGGSSLVAYCLLFGMILALIREDKWE